MPTVKVELFIQDEISKFGCGKRYLTAKIGRKWVRLTDSLGRTKRISKQLYESLNPIVTKTIEPDIDYPEEATI